MPTKRHLPLLLATLSAPLYAQSFLQTGTSGPALPPQADAPQHWDMGSSHKCQSVHNGDIVHYTLDIRGTQYSRAVFSNLHMRLGRAYEHDALGLPAPDFRNLGGGGSATRDAKYGNLYHFTFKVPMDVMSGIYHGAGVYVSATDSFDASSAMSVEVNNRTMKHVRDFCLIVVSPYGGGGRPLVTNFHGDKVERIAYTPTTQTPGSRVYLPTAPASGYASPSTSPVYTPLTTSSTYLPAAAPSNSLPAVSTGTYSSATSAANAYRATSAVSSRASSAKDLTSLPDAKSTSTYTPYMPPVH